MWSKGLQVTTNSGQSINGDALPKNTGFPLRRQGMSTTLKVNILQKCTDLNILASQLFLNREIL
jgi:hypothetical protein